MSSDIRAAIEILDRAMQIERDGHKFYLEAAQTTEDKKGQEMFSKLADDEQNHFDLIQKQKNSVIEDNIWTVPPGMKVSNIDLSKPLFPEGGKSIDKTVSKKSGEGDALIFGMEIEKNSFDLYHQAVEQMDDPMAKQMFTFLAGEEQAHFEILMMRYDLIFGPVMWRY